MYFYNLTSKRKVYSVRKSTNMLYLQNNVEKGKTKAAARVIPANPQTTLNHYVRSENFDLQDTVNLLSN